MLGEKELVIEVSPGSWILSPGGPWSDAVHELSALYARDRAAVMDLLTETALERLRDGSARAFADAFVLRKPKKGDHDG